MNIRIIGFCIALISSSGIALGQSLDRSVIATGGDYFKTPSYSLSWTIGEPVSETFSNVYMTLTQGFQQADKFTVTAIREPLAGQFDIKVFPNPTPDVLNINVNSDKDEIITAQIYSMSGVRVLSEKILDKNLTLSLADLSSASYLLSLRRFNGELITTYVINKTK